MEDLVRFLFSKDGFSFLVVGVIVMWVIYRSYIRVVYTPTQIKHRWGSLNPSYFFYRNQLRGLRWALPRTIKWALGKTGERKLYLNNFSFSSEVSRFSKFTKWISNNTKAYLSINDLRKQLLIFGEMGTGKTEFLWNLLYQLDEHRAVIFDVKGDFHESLCDGKRAWSANPFDENGRIWNIFEEENFWEVADFFSKNIINSAVGSEERNFFTTSAADRICKILEKTYLKKERVEVWGEFSKEIDQYQKDAFKAQEHKENMDVYNNVILVLEFLKFWAWRAQQKNVKFFNISDFFKSNEKMILHSNNIKTKSFFAGLLSAIVYKHSTLQDLKKDEDNYTVYLLDEYLQLDMEDNARTALHTFLRSKGGLPIIGTQKLPTNDKHSSELISSSFGIILFSIGDEKTRKYLEGAFDQVEFKEFIKEGKDKYRQEVRSKPFISAQQIIEIPQFNHLSLMKRAGKGGLYYLAKTDLIDKDDFGVFKPLKFKKVDESEFKASLYQATE